MPKTAEPWSLTSLREKLVKIGAKVVSHHHALTFSISVGQGPLTRVLAGRCVAG